MIALLLLLGAWFLALPAVMTGYGETAGLENITSKATWFGLFVTSFKLALTKASGAAEPKFEITGSEGKGFTANAVVVFTKINAVTTVGEKVGNFIVGRPYFVIAATANTFTLGLEEGSAAIEPGIEIKAESEVTLLKEISYQAAAHREKLTWTKKVPTATQVSSEYTAAEVIVKVEKSQTVTYGGWWESETGQGAAKRLIGVNVLEAAEPFTNAGEYKLTSDSISYILGTLIA